MSKVQMLRSLLKQRLTAAAEEIFGLVERTIAEYEEELCRSKEENERQRKLLDAVFNPQLRLHRAGPQPSTQQEDGPSPPTSRLGSSRHRGEETVEHQKLKLLQQMSASIVSKPAPDAYTSFGNHVADELRLIKNVAIQTNVKRKIMNALFEFQEADQCSQQPSTLLPPAPYPTFSPAQTPAHLTHTNTVTNPSPCRPYYSGTTYTNL